MNAAQVRQQQAKPIRPKKNPEKRKKAKANKRARSKVASQTNIMVRSAALGKNSAMVKYLTKAATQMVNPARTVVPVVLPDPGSAQVCARKFTRTVAFSQANFPVLKVAMFPNLFMPGFVAGGASQLVPAAGTGSLQMNGTFTAASDASNSVQGAMRLIDGSGNTALGAVSGIADSVSTVHNGYVCNVPSGSSVTVYVKNNSAGGLVASAPATVFTLWLKLPGGPWSVQSATPVIPAGKDIYQTTTVGAGGPYTAMGFTITGTNGHPASLDVSVVWSNAQVNTAGGLTFAPAFGDQIIDNNITSGRVTHLSMYVRNTTAPLYASGTITAARVPPNFDLGANQGNWTLGSTLLPQNRYYTGPMKHGSYVFWIPQQLDEFQVDNIAQKQESYKGSEYLITEIPDWIAGATCEITFTWIVEFYTPNQNFEHIQTPPMNADFEAAWHTLLRFSAAMCNPEHDKETGSIVKSIKQTASEVYGFYQDNKEAINAVVAALLASAAAA